MTIHKEVFLWDYTLISFEETARPTEAKLYLALSAVSRLLQRDGIAARSSSAV